MFATTVLPLLEGLEFNGMNTHVLWPHRGSFTWVPIPGFNDHQLVGFADGLLNELTCLNGSTAA